MNTILTDEVVFVGETKDFIFLRFATLGNLCRPNLGTFRVSKECLSYRNFMEVIETKRRENPQLSLTPGTNLGKMSVILRTVRSDDGPRRYFVRVDFMRRVIP